MPAPLWNDLVVRCGWLALLWTACISAGVSGSRYGHLVDSPFLDAPLPPAETTRVAVGTSGGVDVGGLTAQGGVSIEVPGVSITKPEFFGASLEGANDIVFLLDRSGSMLGNRKLDMAKEELARTLAALPDGTRFNVVFFGDRLTPLSRQTLTLDAAVRKQTKRFLRRIAAANNTALVPALWLADQMQVKRVVLLSDGEGTVMGGQAETLSAGRAMIAKGVRFDVVFLNKRDVLCHERTGTTLANSYSAASQAACIAEKAAANVRKLADESGGIYLDPLAPDETL